jgi:hypothetical protein
MAWSMWTGTAAWPYLLVIVVCLIGMLWVTSPAQRSRQRRQDARDRVVLRRALRELDELDDASADTEGRR